MLSYKISELTDIINEAFEKRKADKTKALKFLKESKVLELVDQCEGSDLIDILHKEILKFLVNKDYYQFDFDSSLDGSIHGSKFSFAVKFISAIFIAASFTYDEEKECVICEVSSSCCGYDFPDDRFLIYSLDEVYLSVFKIFWAEIQSY